MTETTSWVNCVQQRGQEVSDFVSEHLGSSQRKALLIAGAGFDPRSTTITREISAKMNERVQGLFLKEERPNPPRELADRATRNLQRMTEMLVDNKVMSVNVFADDGAVIGGREIIRILSSMTWPDRTDLIIDLSALSRGVAFPAVRYLLDRAQKSVPSFNLHLMVNDSPDIDGAVVSVACDKVATMHGFRGKFHLDETSRAAKLWLPQYGPHQRAVLERIYNYVSPDDVCPILPFPSSNPRWGDELIDHYRQEFETVWGVDARNIVHADEKSPLDLYRAILRIDDARKRVFSEVGGSLLILTPIGSKAMAIGALMAAIDRDFPIAYIEAIGYTVDCGKLDAYETGEGEFVHVWLHGEAYQN